MTDRPPVPATVLLCHEGDALETRGLTRWIAASLRLAGVIAIRGSRGRQWRALRREFRRGGARGALDVVAFQAFYRCTRARADAAWERTAVERLEARYPPVPADVPRIVVEDPNGPAVAAFLDAIAPDVMLARCRMLLRPTVYERPRLGTVVLHPGICPEYRNAHGCFWALAARDLDRVGMTLLRIDRGVDTGPIYLQTRVRFRDSESHVVIQHRAVLEELDAIAGVLTDLHHGRAEPIPVNGRRSATWGHPTLSAYLRWKRAARRERHVTADCSSVS